MREDLTRTRRIRIQPNGGDGWKGTVRTNAQKAQGRAGELRAPAPRPAHSGPRRLPPCSRPLLCSRSAACLSPTVSPPSPSPAPFFRLLGAERRGRGPRPVPKQQPPMVVRSCRRLPLLPGEASRGERAGLHHRHAASSNYPALFIWMSALRRACAFNE